MVATPAFDIYPRQILSGQTIRCFDKTTVSGVTENYCIFLIEDYQTFTASSTPNLYVTDADLKFEVGQQVGVKSATGTLPTGLSGLPTVYYIRSVTSTYVTLSTSIGGSAVAYSSAGSGTLQIFHASKNIFNPLIRPCPVATTTDISITFYVYDSAGAATNVRVANILRMYPTTTAVAKPLSTSKYARVSIFLYDDTNATAVNRIASTGNNLFFQSLKVVGSMNKAGTVAFKVVDPGTATATEKGLLEADKNVAIILGHNVIWSGKILRSTQGEKSLYDSAAPFSSWTVECESDISKMKFQNVKAANQIYCNAPVGYIVNKLVENDAAGEIDWRGVVEKSSISFEGPNIVYTINKSDMYTQLMTLATLSGYDWRTRNNYVKYLYGATAYNSGAKTVDLTAIAPYTTNSFQNRWLIFTNDTNADTTDNYIGVQSYGLVASNTTSKITLAAITNDSIPPASSGNILILGDPVLDFVSDLRQPSYQCTFSTNKARAAALQNCYEFNDKSDFKQVATKIVAKGKTVIPDMVAIYNGYVSSGSQTGALAGKDAMGSKGFFNNSTYITFRTQGYVHSIDVANKYIYLIGQNYSFKTSESCNVCWSSYHTADSYNCTISDISVLSASDGTPVTRLTVSEAVYAGIPKYSIFRNGRIYVADNSIVTHLAGDEEQVNVGFGVDYVSVGALDAVYGPYITRYSSAASDTVCPHIPGCMVSTQATTEATPEDGSPIDKFGLITKTVTIDQGITPSELEVYATQYLFNHSNYYRKGSFLSIIYDWFKTDLRPTNQVTEANWIMEGDEIAVLQNVADTSEDLQYGILKNQWQILSWTFDAIKMTVSCELGDFEMNTNSLINEKTAGINFTIT